MKISQSIVVAALLGFLSHSEVVEAVERHHHHHDYVQFMPKIHPEGVVMLKDFGLANNGYPYQSLSVVSAPDAAPPKTESGTTNENPKDPVDKGGDVKLPKVTVDTNAEKTEAEKAETKAVEDANEEKQEAIKKEAKELKEKDATEGKIKPQKLDADEVVKVKEQVKELKAELEKHTTKTEEDLDTDFKNNVEQLARKAEVDEHAKEVKKLTKAIEVEDDEENKPKLIKKLEAAKIKVEQDSQVEAPVIEKDVEKEKIESEIKQKVELLKAQNAETNEVKAIISKKMDKLDHQMLDGPTPKVSEEQSLDMKVQKKIAADKKAEEELAAKYEAEEEQKVEKQEERLAKDPAVQAEKNFDLVKAQEKVVKIAEAEKEVAIEQAIKATNQAKAKATAEEDAKNSIINYEAHGMSEGEYKTANMRQGLIDFDGQTHKITADSSIQKATKFLQLRNGAYNQLSESESSSSSDSSSE